MFFFVQDESPVAAPPSDRLSPQSDEEFYDASDGTSVGEEAAADRAPCHVMSPSMSVVTLEGDPPHIEEDRDFNETNNVDGKFGSTESKNVEGRLCYSAISCVCMWVRVSLLMWICALQV